MTLKEELNALSDTPDFLSLDYEMVRTILLQVVQKNPSVRRHQLNGVLRDDVKSELMINGVGVHTERMIGYENSSRTILSW